MSEKHTLSALTAQITIAGNFAALYLMLVPRESAQNWYFPAVLLLYAPLIYAVNRLFLRVEQSLQSLWVLNAAAAILFLALCSRADGWSGLSDRLPMMAVFTGWVTIRGAYSSLRPPTLSAMLLCLDGSILMLILFSAYASYTGLELVWSIPSVLGFAAAVLGTTARRSSRNFGRREWLFMAAAFGVIFAVMWLLMSLIAIPAGNGLVSLWNALRRLAVFVGEMALRFLMFLASLIPLGQQELLPIEPAASIAPAEMGEVEADPLLGLIILAVALAGTIVCIVWLVRKVGKRSLGGRTVKKTAAYHRTRPSLQNALKRLWAEWKGLLLTETFLWTHRNTAAGLYFLLVRRCRALSWRALPGETPREFLTRLAQRVEKSTSLADGLSQLSCAADAVFYGGDAVSREFPQAPQIRREFRRVLRRHRLREICSHARERSSSKKSNRAAK